MGTKRRDNKGRVLRNNEYQNPDGRYSFKYWVNGKAKFIYSWKLEKTDKVPSGKRDCIALREREKEIKKDLSDGIFPNADEVTVIELVEKYLQTKTGIKATTMAGYQTAVNILKEQIFSQNKIAKIKLSDAKNFFIKLQKEQGRSFSTVHSLKSVLKPAWQLAVDDDLVRKNVFDFPLSSVIYDDSVKREALTKAEEANFLHFVEQDDHYKYYYDPIYILFKTGMRIAEFSGLTIADLDFQNRTIKIDHQLQRTVKKGLHVTDTKTGAGTRILPMSDDVAKCFENMLKNRKAPKVEPMIDGYCGFLMFTSKGTPFAGNNWAKIFQAITEKYNATYRVQIRKVTPHICRHTYCSNMAKAGMNPKALQYLMGHSDISTTLDTYTHLKLEDARDEISNLHKRGMLK